MSSSRISRRAFLTALGLGSTALAAQSMPGLSPSVNISSDRPNLLLIHTDQQSQWTVSAFPRLPGDRVIVETPHLDSIAVNGARIDNFFVNQAVCSPSRSALMTGRYPQFTNVWKNGRPLNPDEITLAHALSEAGYDTGYCGKWHLSGEAKPGWGNPNWEDPDVQTYGFRDADFMWNRGHFKEVVEDLTGAEKPEVSSNIGDESTYSTDFFTRKAVDFIQKERTEPFFLMVSFPDPHTPYKTRDPYGSQYLPENMTIPPTIDDEDETTCREIRTQYCGMVKLIDDGVGKLIDTLHQTGQYENTIIFYTSDHGDFMGEHGLYKKGKFYETVFRVPCLIQWPGHIPAGSIVKHVMSNVDVHPTMLSLMGLVPNTRIQGTDGSKVLLETESEWLDQAFGFHRSGLGAAIFTQDWHLFVMEEGYEQEKVPKRALYDRLNDPWQMNNLYFDQNHKQIREMLLTRLIDFHRNLETVECEWLETQYGLSSSVSPLNNNNPESHDLKQNFPNPFNPETRIEFQLSNPSNVSLKIYNIQGKEILTLIDEYKEAGQHAVTWNGNNRFGKPAGSGVYFYHMDASSSEGDTIRIRRMIKIP
ncbi:hypothetical protein BVY01_01055 [bacterium I07]|nr:hypothetical protein BVY01_01055 [bacterium I07]